MSSNVKRVENSKAEISLTTSWADIEKTYNKLIDDYKGKITLPGFRKGKAPRDVVEKKIGKDVLTDAVLQSMDDAMKVAFDNVEAKYRPLPYSQPEVLGLKDMIPFKTGEDVNFTISYETIPEIEIKEYKGLEVEYPNVVISDDMVNTEIERYRNQNAEIKSKDNKTVEKGDLVTIDYTNMDSDNPNGKVEDYTFTAGENQNYYKFDDEIIGMKEGESKEFTINYTQENKPEGLDRDSAHFSATVKSVKSKILPEINDEFAQDIKSEYKTVKDMKDGIKENLTKGLESRLRETKIDLIAQKMLEKNPDFDIPESMIQFEINNSYSRFASQMGMKAEDMDKFLSSQGQSRESFTSSWRDSAKSNLKKQLVISKVGEIEKIEADEEKVAASLKAQIPENTPESQKKQYEAIIRDNLAYDATIEFLIKENKLKAGKKEISYEDFASGKYLEKETEEK